MTGSEKLFNCFRASCGISGKVAGEITAEYIERVLEKEDTVDTKESLLPKYLVPIEDLSKGEQDRVFNILRYYNSFDTYIEGRVLIYYDFSEERMIFLNQHGYLCEGGVGRAINRNRKPKWRMYGQARQPLLVPHKGSVYEPLMQNKGVLVEDAFSACAVSRVTDGICLLGTNIPDTYMEFLRRYKELVVCLDADASLKALKLHHKLMTLPAKITMKILDRDLKYENSTTRIAEILQ